MNRQELRRAAEAISGHAWTNGAPSQLGRLLQVNAQTIHNWERTDNVPRFFADRIQAYITKEGIVMPAEPEVIPPAPNGQPRVVVEDNSLKPLPDPVGDAIRLWQIDQAMMHLTRNAGLLGLGANAVDRLLREERNQIVERLGQLVTPDFQPKGR